VLTKALLARLFAVLISGTLASAPFSCCCARMQSQELEGLLASHAMAAMDGMSDEMATHQLPDGDHLCPHKVTASLQAGKAILQPLAIAFAQPVVHSPDLAGSIPPHSTAPGSVLRIRPPPIRAATLVSQHILLLI
jgi:hypothetical protein